MKKTIFTILAILLFAFPCQAKKGGGQGPGVQAISFNVTVTNTDSGECGASEFELVADPPIGWTAVFNDPLLPLEPGAVGTTSLQVSYPKNAAAGSYVIPITVIHPNGSEFNTTTEVVVDIVGRGKGKK